MMDALLAYLARPWHEVLVNVLAAYAILALAAYIWRDWMALWKQIRAQRRIKRALDSTVDGDDDGN